MASECGTQSDNPRILIECYILVQKSTFRTPGLHGNVLCLGNVKQSSGHRGGWGNDNTRTDLSDKRFDRKRHHCQRRLVMTGNQHH